MEIKKVFPAELQSSVLCAQAFMVSQPLKVSKVMETLPVCFMYQDACFFLLLTMRCHADLSCPYGNQVGQGLVCLCAKGDASFSI